MGIIRSDILDESNKTLSTTNIPTCWANVEINQMKHSKTIEFKLIKKSSLVPINEWIENGCPPIVECRFLHVKFSIINDKWV